MVRLSTLSSLVKRRKRVGRGGDRGGTSGRGHKGQKARTSGGVRLAFEGGQMPLYRRLPKRGFNNTQFRPLSFAVNIGRINEICADGDVITKEFLVKKGVIRARDDQRFSLKILGNGELTKKLIFQADSFSKSAREAIEKVGGVIQAVSLGEGL